MQRLVQLQNNPVTSTTIEFTRDGDMNVAMKINIVLPSDLFNPPPPAMGNDKTETVISDGNLHISSAKIVATNSNTTTELEITGNIESKRPGTGRAALRLLLDKIEDNDLRDALKEMLL